LGFFQKDYTPTNRGFDSFLGFYTGDETYYSHSHTFTTPPPEALSFTGYDFRKSVVRNMEIHEEVYTEAEGRHSSLIFEEEAIRIINEYAEPTPNQKPMFMYLALQNVRMPLELPPDTDVEACNDMPEGPRKTYCYITSNMDTVIGNIINALENAGILDDTLIVFSTDNGGDTVNDENGGVANCPDVDGGARNDPLKGGKFSLWEGGVKGVSFITGAGITGKRQGRYDGLMHITDWFPTLINVACGTVGAIKLDGVDQWEAITEDEEYPRDDILHNINPRERTAALRCGDWKIVVEIKRNCPAPSVQYDGVFDPPNYDNIPSVTAKAQGCLVLDEDNEISLFNIAVDPGEEKDLAEQEKDKVQQLLDKINEYCAVMVDPVFPDRDPKSNPVWKPWINPTVVK